MKKTIKQKIISIAQSYNLKIRRKVVLSTGDVIEVRALTKADGAALGNVPDEISDPANAEKLANPETAGPFIARNLEFFQRLSDYILTHCILTPDFKVVTNKPLMKCADDEIHVSILEEDDIAAITTTVMGGKPKVKKV